MEELKTGQEIKTDYYTCSFDLPIIDKDEEKIIVDEKLEEFMTFLNVKEVLKTSKDKYKYSYKLAEGIQMNFVGPKSRGVPTMNIELKGEGCREFERLNPDKSLKDLLEFTLIKHQGRPSRMDVALDDFDGKLCPFNWVREKLDNGYFITIFKDKEYAIHGSKSKGYTIAFGSRNGSKQLSIYQKNLQKKMKDIYWTRFEMRFYHNDAINAAHDLLNALTGKHQDIKASGENGFKLFTIGHLLSMLDIKEDNNYDENHQYMVNRDPRWNEFTGDPLKLKVSKIEKRPNKWLTYREYCKSLLGMFMLVLIISNNYNFYHVSTELIEMANETIQAFTPRRLSQLNRYLNDNNHESIDNDKLIEVQMVIQNELEVERRLPF